MEKNAVICNSENGQVLPKLFRPGIPICPQHGCVADKQRTVLLSSLQSAFYAEYCLPSLLRFLQIKQCPIELSILPSSANTCFKKKTTKQTTQPNQTKKDETASFN